MVRARDVPLRSCLDQLEQTRFLKVRICVSINLYDGEDVLSETEKRLPGLYGD